MVADRFGVEGHAGHESEGGDEVGKFVLAVEFSVAVLPMGQALQVGLEFGESEGRHGGTKGVERFGQFHFSVTHKDLVLPGD